MDKAKVLNRVYASSLPSRAKTVMFYLVNRSNKELTCFPAVPTIAKETGLSERTVQRALKELCEEGYVEKNPRYRENGGQSSNLYTLIAKENEDYKGECLGVEVSDQKICEIVGRSSELKGCQHKMQVIDFSFYVTTSLFNACHRVGDNCVPP